ncbi:CCA tRNA nucleotidyltransferase [Halalkalibacter urbisdiaboli]|uniref:CCA tRNA nucleotidyltransferase n=1 Tax=Halalkalibacter urbisdiaboli TaxID=1960589 RepID=UPI000B4456BF|nr:CCA tRNA nucleotidyltransferase [Halalkalibacter urbisdiaboli]
MDIFAQTAPLLNCLQAKGHRAFIVGGAVRDALLKRAISDIDIVTSAEPEEIHALFPNTFMMNNQHQTVIVRFEGLLFEVTTERGNTIEEDLLKRDFTINSMAINEEGSLLDPTNGQEDLKMRRLRSFQPAQRMSEDPLRLLRALRFISELGFDIDGELLEVIHSYHPSLRNVAIERVIKEFEKLFRGTYRNAAIQHLLNTHMYSSLPMMKLTEQKVKRLLTLPSFQGESDVICWTTIAYCFEWTEKELLKSLTLSNRLIQDIKERLRYIAIRQKQEWTPWLLYKAGINTAQDVERLRAHFGHTAETLQQMWDGLPIKGKNELALTGTDLLKQVQAKAGPWVKDELEWAEKAVVTGALDNDKLILLEQLARRRDKH